MAADLSQTLGRNLRAHREALGLSQEAFAAEVLKVHRTYAGMLERGERNITLATLEWLAAKLEVAPQALLEPPEAGGSGRRGPSRRQPA